MPTREDTGQVVPANGHTFAVHDIDYIWQAAHGQTALVQFGNTRPEPDSAFPFQLLHENLPPDEPDGDDVTYEVTFGQGADVRRFRLRHLLNASAMSLGGINDKLVEAVAQGQRGLGLVNTGEGGPSIHLGTGADLVLQIGTAKFGLGVPAPAHGRMFARLDLDRLAELVRTHEHVRLVELKLSQGAKPGVVSLPGSRVSPLVAKARGVLAGVEAVSPPQHYELLGRTREEKYDKLCAWIHDVRVATGLPVGIKLCVGRPQEVVALVERFRRTGCPPDFMTIDSAYGGTSSAHACTANYVGYGDVYESIGLVDDALRATGLRERVVLCASGALHTPAYAVAAFAHGADAVFVARGFLYAAAAANGVAVRQGVSPYSLTDQARETAEAIDVARTAQGLRSYSVQYDQDVRLLTWLLGHRSPRDLDRSCLRRRHDRAVERVA
ncbi:MULTISPECIES: glutamate synthase-related protein [Micromonospora]|uniref:glutamate synthase-related protein n=1 Tax=Micromonospora TaxID=1873 RepID=UPI0006965150|nr:glutamate synthase-related protein [Micromonospora haikouensis]